MVGRKASDGSIYTNAVKPDAIANQGMTRGDAVKIVRSAVKLIRNWRGTGVGFNALTEAQKARQSALVEQLCVPRLVRAARLAYKSSGDEVLSQSDAAGSILVTQKTWQRYESGSIAIDLKTILAIMFVLGHITQDDLPKNI